MTNEVMMIPTQEFERLQDFYKGQITQSALLNKAGRLAAEKHLILKNPKIPDATAVRMVKPLARDQFRLTKTDSYGRYPTRRCRCPGPRRTGSHGRRSLGKLVEKTCQTDE